MGGFTDVSIHAPAKGATLLVLIYFYESQCFNPRSREGSDPRSLNVPPVAFVVSIHAPAKGATYNNHSDSSSFMFQSTLPRRERPQFQPKIHSNFQQKSTNYHFIYLVFPFSHSLFSIIHFICAHFRVRIPRHFHVRFLFALLYYHKINVSSTAIPRSTPICSTFV